MGRIKGKSQAFPQIYGCRFARCETARFAQEKALARQEKVSYNVYIEREVMRMTVEKLARELEAQVLSAGGFKRTVSGGLVCDIMSRALSQGFEGMAWITHQNNLNALAVAVLTDAACLIFPADMPVEQAVLEQAAREQTALLRVEYSALEAAARMWAAGIRGEAMA